MANLKLAKLPDRTPVRLMITVPPELHQKLMQYAQAYEAAYEKRESVPDLVPFMLASFLDTDRGFARFLVKGPSGE